MPDANAHPDLPLPESGRSLQDNSQPVATCSASKLARWSPGHAVITMPQRPFSKSGRLQELESDPRDLPGNPADIPPAERAGQARPQDESAQLGWDEFPP